MGTTVCFCALAAFSPHGLHKLVMSPRDGGSISAPHRVQWTYRVVIVPPAVPLFRGLFRVLKRLFSLLNQDDGAIVVVSVPCSGV
jgi:hypothetical protein